MEKEKKDWGKLEKKPDEEGKGLKVQPDKTDILAFMIAFWHVFFPAIFAFFLLFLAAILILLLT
ncbi:MAG: hypothetical protein KAX04_06050 [Methanomicrobia archaeon]|nr:hypothetical protein [Methanomicrobia archaeon]MCK4311078.1 hypothetical protein [Methanomicrobia archaeon]